MKALVSQRHLAVYDPGFTRALRAIPWEEWHRQDRPFFCREEYLARFAEWIASSRLNEVRGLDRFRHRDLINGTTQTFDEAYFQHHDRRLRVFRGEYAYHRRIFRNHLFLEDGPLSEGDFVIVSAPFCSTGELHSEFHSLLDRAVELGVPVIVDCAYFGTCMDFRVDLSHPAIESVSFSLTKGLGLGDIRSGIRFSNLENDHPIRQQNRFNHSVLAAARIGIYMMEKFGPDHIPTRFRGIQVAVCGEIGATPRPCIHLAAGGSEWDHFRVDGLYNNLGIRDLIRARQKGLI